MENMIAGKQTSAGVPVYVYSESDKNYHFDKVVPEDDLKVVGKLAGKVPTLVGR